MLTYSKVIVSGKYVEVFTVSTPYKIDEATQKQREEYIKIDVDRSEEYVKQAVQRSKTKIRRLIYSNFNRYDKFITLTFKDDHDLDYCYKQFHAFMLKFRKHLHTRSIKYLCVAEFQKKRGVVHFHLIADVNFIDFKVLTRLWGNGFVWVRPVGDIKKAGYYLTKYLTKDSFSDDFKGRRRFFRSIGLRIPLVMYGVNAMSFRDVFLADLVPLSSKVWQSDYNGKVFYKCYWCTNIDDFLFKLDWEGR